MADFWLSGQLLAGAAGAGVSVWNPATANNGQAPQQHNFTAASQVNSLQWNNNNKVLAYAGAGGRVDLRNQEQYLGELASPSVDEVNVLRFSKDSRRLIVGTKSSNVVIWDLKTQLIQNTISSHKSSVVSLCMSMDDETLVSSSADGAVMLHPVGPNAAGRTSAVLCAEDRCAKRSLCFSPTDPGVIAAACDDGTLAVWNIAGASVQHSKLPQLHTSKQVTGVAFTPVSPAVLYSCAMDRTVLVWDRRKNQVVQQAVLPSALTCLTMRDDGSYIGLGTADGSAFVLDARNLKQACAQLHAAHRTSAINELHWQSTKMGKRTTGSSRAAAAAGATSNNGSAPQEAAGAAGASRVGTASSGGGTGMANVQSASLSNWLKRSSTSGGGAEPLPTPPSMQSGAPAAPPSAASSDAEMAMDITPPPALPWSRQHQQQPAGAGAAGAAAAVAASTASTSTFSLAANQSSSSGASGASDGAALKEATNQMAGLSNLSRNGSLGGPAGSCLDGKKAPAPGAATAAGQAAQLRPAVPASAGNTAAPGAAGIVPPPRLAQPEAAPTPMDGGSGSTTPSSPSRLGGIGSMSMGPLRGGAAAGAGGGTPRAMLSEGVFKSFMDDLASTLREDVRNLHIEMLKQFHVQQMEFTQIARDIMQRQDTLAADVHALRQQLDHLLRKQAAVDWL